jgi:hypothetical protein
MDSCKNKFLGKKVFLFAPGPTLNDFDKNIIPSEYLKAGVNGVIIHKDYQDLDLYFWSGDINTSRHPTPSEQPIRNHLHFLKQIPKFTNTTINKKSTHPMWGQTQILQHDADRLGFISYDINFGKAYEDPVDTWHIDPIINGFDGCSISLAACQWLIYMGFKEIILVGCDCTSKHSYEHLISNDKCDWELNQLVNRWIKFRHYVSKHFPDVQIKSVNPQGLKDVFPVYN